MVKAENIIKIKKEYDKYNKLLNNECDFIKRLKYERILRDLEYKLFCIEMQISNIEISINNEPELHVSLFKDRYINNIPVSKLTYKYNMSKATIYKKLIISKKAFESDGWDI